jgi:hypothetical protein
MLGVNRSIGKDFESSCHGLSETIHNIWVERLRETMKYPRHESKCPRQIQTALLMNISLQFYRYDNPLTEPFILTIN